MIATTHLAVGATAGLWAGRLVGGWVSADLPTDEAESALIQTVVQLGTAFIVGTISHFALDAIPHSEAIYHSSYGERPVLASELLVIFSIILWLCRARDLNFLIVFFGMAGGAWLDCLSMLRDTALFNNTLVNLVIQLHDYFHATSESGPIPSLPIQILVAIIALIFLF